MEANYEIVDKQCAWQQDRLLDSGDGRPCGWVQWWTTKLQVGNTWGYKWAGKGRSLS